MDSPKKAEEKSEESWVFNVANSVVTTGDHFDNESLLKKSSKSSKQNGEEDDISLVKYSFHEYLNIFFLFLLVSQFIRYLLMNLLPNKIKRNL